MAMTSRHQAPRVQVLHFAIFCVILMAANGYFYPLSLTPDSGDYLSTADEIVHVLRDGGSLLDVTTKFRIVGYPFVLALLELVFGSRPFLAVYVLHAAIVVATGTLVFWTLLRLRVASLVAAVLSALYIAAVPAMLASFLLTDTISNALTAIAVCLLAEPLFKPTKPALARVALAGLSIGLAFFSERQISTWLFASCRLFSQSPGFVNRRPAGSRWPSCFWRPYSWRVKSTKHSMPRDLTHVS